MADTVTSQTLVDGQRNVVMKFTNVSDGTGESAVLKVDVSALSEAPSEVRIDQIQYDIEGMALRIQWDATSDVDALILSGQGLMDFRAVGGLKNNSGAGKTGDILFSTIGASANDTYSVIMWMRKK